MKGWLQERLEQLGYRPCAYSGRGMFGKECLGIVIPNIQSLFSLGIDIGEHREDGDESPGNPKTDNIGYNIVAYWPSIPYEKED